MRSNDKLALNIADAASPKMEVFVVEAQLEMVVTKQTSAERKQLTVAAKELVLAEAFGGERRSIISVTACPNHLVRIRVADRAGSSVWRDALVQSLTSDGGCSVSGGHFISIRAKRGDVRVVRLLRDSSDGEAVELNHLQPQDIEARICNFVFGQKPLFLYGSPLDGDENSMVWNVSSDAPQTPLNKLGPIGPIISPEGVIFTDIRSIFKPHEGIDSPILFQVLKHMLQNETLHAYKIVRVPYRPIMELCHPFFGPHSLWQLSEEYQDGGDQADTSGDYRHGGCSGCDDCDSSGSDDGEGGKKDAGGDSGGN